MEEEQTRHDQLILFSMLAFGVLYCLATSNNAKDETTPNELLSFTTQIANDILEEDGVKPVSMEEFNQWLIHLEIA